MVNNRFDEALNVINIIGGTNNPDYKKLTEDEMEQLKNWKK